MSKIQSESKSQQFRVCGDTVIGCGIYVKDTIWKQITTIKCDIVTIPKLWYLCQRYNLKANHNKGCWIVDYRRVVVSMSKIQSESKSQLGCRQCWGVFVVVSMSKIQSESKSQRQSANSLFCNVVVSMSKIQSESKSQHIREYFNLCNSCGIYVKDTIWKQITTVRDKRSW